jgi:hypothetical protein
MLLNEPRHVIGPAPAARLAYDRQSTLSDVGQGDRAVTRQGHVLLTNAGFSDFWHAICACVCCPFELRAALALAKLYRDCSRDDGALAVLAPALEGFAPTSQLPEIDEASELMAATKASTQL